METLRGTGQLVVEEMSCIMVGRVPSEFIGKARVFRANMITAATDVGAQMAAIRDYWFGLYRRRNSLPRPWHMVAIEQKWRSISAAGCLRLAVQRERQFMLIEDTRIAAAQSSNSQWGGATETSILIVASSLALARRKVETQAATVAAVSLHAMARWYQRALVTNDAEMLSDLALIVAAAPVLLAEPADVVEVPSRNGGSWRGSIVATTDGKPVVNVRTFL